MNIVYHSVHNPIRIFVPNAVTFEASAPGLKKVDDFGNYTIYPHGGKTVDLIIKSVFPNGDTITNIKTLRIREVEQHVGTFNNKSGFLELKKKHIINGEIGVKINNFAHEWVFHVKGFKIKLPNYKFIDVLGNVIPIELNEKINNLNTGDVILIFDIAFKLENAPNNLRISRAHPIKIIIKN